MTAALVTSGRAASWMHTRDASTSTFWRALYTDSWRSLQQQQQHKYFHIFEPISFAEGSTNTLGANVSATYIPGSHSSTHECVYVAVDYTEGEEQPTTNALSTKSMIKNTNKLSLLSLSLALHLYLSIYIYIYLIYVYLHLVFLSYDPGFAKTNLGSRL